jgi:hypothetical protein
VKKALLLSIVVCAVLSGAAAAQNYENPLALKVGVFWPTDDGVKGLVGNTWFSVAVDYTLQKNYETSTEVVLSAGFMQKSDAGSKVRVIPITLDWIYRQPREEKTTTPYFGVGAGAYLTKIEDGLSSEGKTKFGGSIFAGLEFGQNMFVEGRYVLVGGTTVSGVDYNTKGFSLMLGAKLRT